MQDILNDGEPEYDEEWLVVLHTKGEYTLSKNQAIIVKQAMVSKEKFVVFDSFTLSLPYIVEFYRKRKFLKGTMALPSQAKEQEYKPIPPEKWVQIRKKMAEKIGKKI